MFIKTLSTIVFISLSLGALASSHCDVNIDKDCKERVDLLDAWTGKNDKLDYPDGQIRTQDYNLFYNIGDYFEKLVENKMYMSAAKLYAINEHTYFLKKPTFGGRTPYQKLEESIKTTAKAILATFEPEVAEYIQKTRKVIRDIKQSGGSDESNWSLYKQLLNTSFNSKYSQKIIIRTFVAKHKTELRTTQRNLRITLIEDASRAFKKYSLEQGVSFFAKYPIKLTNLQAKKVVNSASEYIQRALGELPLKEALRVVDKYKLKNASPELQNSLSGIFLKKAIQSKHSESQPQIRDILIALNQVSDMGLKIDNKLSDDYKISAVPLESEHIPRATFASSGILSKSSFSDSSISKSPYIVTYESIVNSVETKDKGLSKVTSKYAASSAYVDNSRYRQLQNSYQNALNAYNYAVRRLEQYRENEREDEQRAYDRALAQQRNNNSFNCDTSYSSFGNSSTSNCRSTNSGFSQILATNTYNSYKSGKALGNALTLAFGGTTEESGINNDIRQAENRMKSYRAALNKTPSQVKETDYREYSFDTRKYEVVKKSTRIFNVINTIDKTYSTFEVPIEEKKVFNIADGLSDDDYTYTRNHFQAESDIEIFLNKPDAVSVKDVINLLSLEYPTTSYDNFPSLIGGIQSLFKERVKENIHNYRSQALQKQEKIAQSEASKDYVAQIIQLKALLDNGVINQDEFNALKQNIIDNM